ncbi:MAG: DNA-processing protein DprA [Clostridia bacterium]|nr:DNA-processing protein DprA [Clostridia bacterium]
MIGREDTIYWVWLAETLKAGSRIAARLIHIYGDARAVYHSIRMEDLSDWSSDEKRQVNKLIKERELKSAKEIHKKCENGKIRILCYNDEDYPESLRSLTDPPIVLYVRGNLPPFSKRLTVAVVGTRTMTAYGRKMAYSMGYSLGAGGAIVVSGMALGIDSMAMSGAIDAGALTVAVLGSGVDVIYPKEHRFLYDKITATGGCIISEYPPQTKPIGYHFPTRNRIISGLADTGLVVEAAMKSGALITAEYVVNQGKRLFAVPGPVDAVNSKGANMLLREVALPAINPADILRSCGYMYEDTIDLMKAEEAASRMDMMEQAQKAMEENRIGVRGKTNVDGTPGYGGTIKSAKNKTAAENKPERAADIKHNVTDTPKIENNAASVKKKSEEAGKKENKSKKISYPAIKIDMDMLDETELKVYNNMKPDVPMLPDELCTEDLNIEKVLCAMTMLQIAGLVEASQGGYYVRVTDSQPTKLIDDEETER